jgi:protein required for attachment to host cells
MFNGKTSKGVEVSSTYGFNEAHGNTTWILVTHRTGAKLFETKGPNKPLEFPKEFAFPEGKLTGSETYRDQPGRSFDSSSQSHGGHGTSHPRHALSSEVTHRELSARKFARSLAEMLEKGEEAHHYSKLVIVSEPRFMGVLKNALSPQVAKLISRTLEKDIEEMPNHLLGERLLAMLQN